MSQLEDSPAASAAFVLERAVTAHERYREGGDAAVLDEVIGPLREAAAREPVEAPLTAELWRRLVALLIDRFERTGREDDLEGAVDAGRQGLRCTDAEGKPRPLAQAALAEALVERYRARGTRADLEEASTWARQAVDAMPPSDDGRLHALRILALVLSERYRVSGDGADLDRAIECADEAVARTPEEGPIRAARLQNLAVWLGERYASRGRPADIDRAIECSRESVDTKSGHEADRDRTLIALAIGLARRFRDRGSLADIEEAVLMSGRAVAVSTATGSDRLKTLHNHSVILLMRFRRLRALDDLDVAIAVSAESLGLGRAGHPEVPMISGHLARLLLERFRVTRDASDLDRAIAHVESAVASMTGPHLVSPELQFTSSECLAHRYEINGQTPDLIESARLARAALAARPAGSVLRHSTQLELVRRLEQLYRDANDADALSDALTQGRELLDTLTPDHPDFASAAAGVGQLYLTKFERERRARDLTVAIDLLSQVMAATEKWIGSGLDPTTFLEALANHGRLLVSARMHQDDWPGVLETLERMRTVRHRLDVRRAGAIPAAMDAIQAEAYRQTLDEVRAIESERRAAAGNVRLSPDDRRSHLAAIARRYEESHARLVSLEQSLRPYLAETLDAARIRSLPRSRDECLVYLQPLADRLLVLVVRHASESFAPLSSDDVVQVTAPTTSDLRRIFAGAHPAAPSAAAPLLDHLDAPLSSYRGLIYDPKSSPSAPGSTEMAERADEGDIALDRVMQVADGIMHPLTAHLRRIGCTTAVLIAGDLLSLVPLHACFLDEANTFADEFDTVYAPSASLYAYASSVAATRSSNANANADTDTDTDTDAGAGARRTFVGMANPDWTLPFAEQQVRAIAEIGPESSHIACGHEATRTWLLEHSARADYLDLATHALFDSYEPTRSSFRLAPPHGESAVDALPVERRAREDVLTLDDVWTARLRLKPGVIVTASACETALTEIAKAPDEAQGFPAAFLASGASGVIATLWRVPDRSASLLMRRVYEHMLVDGMSYRHALRSASAWLRTLDHDPDARTSTLASTASASTGTSTSSTRRPFAHPLHWAGFLMFGAL